MFPSSRFTRYWSLNHKFKLVQTEGLTSPVQEKSGFCNPGYRNQDLCLHGGSDGTSGTVCLNQIRVFLQLQLKLVSSHTNLHGLYLGKRDRAAACRDLSVQLLTGMSAAAVCQVVVMTTTVPHHLLIYWLTEQLWDLTLWSCEHAFIILMIYRILWML